MKIVRLFPLVIAIAAIGVAQDPKDEKGCKDSPIISRFPGSYITRCKEMADDTFKFEMDAGAPAKTLEGHLVQIEYQFPKTASKAQVVRNLNTALHRAGYTFHYDSGEYGDFGAHMGKTWIQIEIGGGGGIKETFLEETTLTQDVVANAAAMTSGLKSTGHVVVNGILFDTGKAEVKPESAAALQEVAKMLKADPKLKVYVVGHTDNVGVLAANVDLSKRRAASVAAELTAKYGIAADRLVAYGDGPYAPIASNDSEDGRSMNRRVELVKQ
jgi:OOP family OmpA-OmpF porin